MVSIAAQINSQRPVTYYAPRPSYSAPSRPYVAPSSRYTPPAPSPQGGAVDWNAFSQANAAFRQQNPQPQQDQGDQGGFWGSPFGKGLGFVINNPVTRVATAPINYLQMGGRLATLGVEELAEAMPGAPKPLQNIMSKVPGLGQLMEGVDLERSEADTRSNWSKILSPNTSYGYGELLDEDQPSWMNKVAGLLGDVALDPFTYVGGGATRAVEGATHLDEAMRGLNEATEALKVAQEAGKASDVAKAAKRVVTAEEYVARAPEMGPRVWELPTPRNRAERANLPGELSETVAGRKFLEEMPEEARRAGVRGYQVISQEAKDLLGIAKPGLRIRGGGPVIPGTETIADWINRGGGAVRQGLADLPGGASKFRNIRTPQGLEAPYETLTRGGEGDLLRAATAVQGANVARVGTGGQLARGNRVISHGIKEFFKGKSDEAVRTMVSQAETVAEPNGINKILARILEQYRTVTGRVMDQQFLKNPDTYFPHIMDPKWRRTVAKMAKKGDKSAADFLRHMDTHFDELLEDPAFYADNLMGESGYLEKSRKYGPNPETGEPQTFDIGGVEVTFSEDNVDHVNEQLRKAFPDYKGDFYDTDPKRVLEAYNKSLSRQAGRDVASRRAADVGNPLAFELGGDIDATRLAMNEALARQGPAGLLSTAQGRYDPTQPLPDVPETPVVLGSPEDKARRAQIEAIEAAIGTAPTGKNAAIATAELAATPQPPARIGGIDPADYFRTTESELGGKAQAGQVTRAKTYAAAAAKELNVADAKMRSGVYDLKQSIIQPLRTSISDMGAEIRSLNSRIKTWGKSLKDLGPLGGEVDAIKAAHTQDELTAIIAKVEAEVNNAETKLKRTASSWKGQATRKQRAAEADLRRGLEDLKKLRDDAWEKARAAPRQIREEIELRERTLNQPVREANERLLYAEMEVPVPHNQVTQDAAMETIMAQADEGVDPGELLERYRGIVRDVFRDAKGLVTANADDTAEVAAHRQRYGELLEQIKEIGGKRRRGKFSKANQALWDEAVAEKSLLERALGRQMSPEVVALEDAAKAAKRALVEAPSELRKLDPPAYAALKAAAEDTEAAFKAAQGAATPSVSEFDEAQGRLSELRTLIEDAQRGGPAGDQQALIEAYSRGEIGLDALGKGAGPGDLPALRAERNKLRRQFGPGGKFYQEKQARSILRDMEEYNIALEANTATEREALRIAQMERDMRQEAIIWANVGQTRRHVTQPFGRASELEEMGRGVRETRIPEPIETPPQDIAYDIKQPIIEVGPDGQLRSAEQAIPPPRTEVEAITSLKSLENTGWAGSRAATAEARGLGQDVVAAEAALPGQISFAQARIQLENAVGAEKELGPLGQRAKTYTNLAKDLTDKKNLVVKRDAARAARETIKRDPRSTYTDLSRILDDLEAVAKANPDFADPKLNQVESLLHTYREELSRINEGRMRVEDLDRVVKDAASGDLGKVMIATLNNNWKALHSGPLNTGDIIMDAQLHKMFTNLFEVSRQPKALGRVFNAFTNLFKTYATLSPGFFVRNTIGGVFMNTADGVTLRAQAEGAKAWQQFMQHGTEWLDSQPQRVKDAFAAAAASGAGGRFEDAGVLAKTNSKLYNMISSNPATRMGQRWGTRVEGGMRMGMALDSIDKGMGVQGALQRITRVHFDYNQVSQVDETMKRIIPFWTFMSRNLPLQIQEQWTNPRVYSYYDHLVTNFKEPDAEFTPEYWTRQGAWRTPISIAGAPLYMQPDLGFNRVQSDIKALSDALEGNPGLLFSQTNPMLGATMDFFNKRDSFYNRQYGPEDYKKMSGPVGAPISLIAKLFNQTNEAGQVSENFTNYLQSMIPPLNQIERLLPQASGGDPNPQTWVKRARYLGLPVQVLTPSVQDSEYWRQWREMQDEQDRLEAMAKEAAS